MKRDPINDAIDMLRIVTALILPRDRTAEMIEAYGKSMSNMIAVAMGGSAKVELSKRCLKHIVWPNTAGGWVIWHCPSIKGHTQPHSDDNFFAMYRDDDIAFMWEQYRLTQDAAT